MANEKKLKLDEILRNIEHDKKDVEIIELQKQQLESQLERLIQKGEAYRKMFQQYYSEETGEYHDPETGEVKTEHYKSILSRNENEISECRQKINTLGFDIEKLKASIKKIDGEGKKTKAAEKVTMSDKKELNQKRSKTNKKVKSTKENEENVQNRVNTAKSIIHDDPTKKVDIGKSIKSGLNDQNQTTTYAASLGLNTMGLKIPAGTNLEFISQDKLILLSEIIAYAQHGQAIDYSRKDVQSLLNKPETAGILLKSVPECLSQIPAEVIYRDPKLFHIFDDAVNQKRKNIINPTQNESNENNNIKALGIDPVKQKEEAEFYKAMLETRKNKENEVEIKEEENEDENTLVRSISKARPRHY